TGKWSTSHHAYKMHQ
ncbi:unnamed protein product, partial [Callosobruchus maculatus]